MAHKQTDECRIPRSKRQGENTLQSGFDLSFQGKAWKTYFPAIVVLGFGMAVTVAPLTTVVMNSVAQDRVGAASGINNAVARVAGVLAIAALGIVMVTAFRSCLNPILTNLSLPPSALRDIQADEIKLAAIHLPDNLDAGTHAVIRESVSHGICVWISAGYVDLRGPVCAASAAGAWMMIPDNPETNT